jgi:hypothetical protein
MERKMKKTILVQIIMLIMLFSGSLFAQGNCLDFDGTDDYVNCGTLNLSGSTLTMECWVNVSDFSASIDNVGNIATVMGTEIGGGDTALLRFGDVGPSSANNIQFVLFIGGGQIKLNGSYEFSDDTWYHLAATYNGSQMILYVNGIVDETRNQTGNFISNDTFYFGNSLNENRYFTGQMDDVRIWNDVRTQTEIQNNMYNELTGSEDNLVVYYKLNEGSGQTAYDSAGGHDATLGSTSGSDSSDPAWVFSDAPLPVNLSSFYANYIDDVPTLYWTTQTEENNAYWNVYRGTTDSFETAVNINANDPVPGNGTTNNATDYVYVDIAPVVQNATYWYWIEDVSTDGETTLHDPITLLIPFEDTPITPESYGLNQNYPNPFNPSTSISFALGEDSNVELIIYNVKGEKVKTIFNDHIYADQINSVVWNGVDADGKQVSSGVYFYKLKTGTKEYNKKMLLVK